MVYSKRNEKDESSKYFITRRGYFFAFLVFSFTTTSFTGLVATKDESTVIQILIVEILFILPLNYLMTVIGHYTQSSCVAIGWMQPIMSGYSFCSIVHTCFIVLHDFLMMRDIGVYVFYALTTGGDAFRTCTLFTSIDIYCIDNIRKIKELKNQSTKQSYPLNTTNMATHLFYVYVVEKKYEPSDDEALAYERVITGMLHGLLTFMLPLLLYYFSHIRLSKIFKVFKTLSLILIAMVLLEIILMLDLGDSFDEINKYYDAVKDGWRYTSYQVWLHALDRQMRLGYPLCVHYISLAAMLDPKVSIETAAIDTWFAHILVAALNTWAYLLVKGALYSRIVKKIPSHMTRNMEYLVVFFPAGTNLILTGSSFIFFAFYASLFITWILKSSVLIQLVFNCFTDIFPFAVKYKKYIVPTYLILVTLASCLLFSSKNLDKEIKLLERSQLTCIWVTLFLFAFFALWFYGVTNLCDDVHFKDGQQPPVFWKITLWPVPIFYFFMVLRASKKNTFMISKIEEEGMYAMAILVQLLYAVPFIVRFIYEVIRYVLKRNLLRLVQPQERWGDPDPEERIARRKYPPRLETKFRRRFDYCNHRCLRYNLVLQALDEKEYDYRAALLNVPQELIQEKDYIYSIIRKRTL